MDIKSRAKLNKSSVFKNVLIKRKSVYFTVRGQEQSMWALRGGEKKSRYGTNIVHTLWTDFLKKESGSEVKPDKPNKKHKHWFI